MPVYRDKRSGQWRFRKVVQLPDGERVRIAGTPPINTKVAAEAAERSQIERLLRPEVVGPATEPDPEPAARVPTLREYADAFLVGYLPDQKPRERMSKRQILTGHLIPMFGAQRLDAIRQSDVDAFVAHELKRGITRKTVNNRLAVLSSLLRYAAENEIIALPSLRLNLPRKGAPKAPPILPVPVEDVPRLVAAADDRYQIAILLASEAGLRIGEILGLQWTDLIDGVIRVRRAVDSMGNVGEPKHDKHRDVPISPRLQAALVGAPRRGVWVVPRLDGGMMSYWAARDGVADVYARAGVTIPPSDTGERMPWHSLRHTFGTTCAARGVPIGTLRELMGHADVATTLRYVAVSGRDKVDAIERAFGISWQQGGNTTPDPDPRSPISVEELTRPLRDSNPFQPK